MSNTTVFLLALLALTATSKILVMDASDLRAMLSAPSPFAPLFSHAAKKYVPKLKYRALCEQENYLLLGWLMEDGDVYVEYWDSKGKSQMIIEKCNNPVEVTNGLSRAYPEDVKLGECQRGWKKKSIYGVIDMRSHVMLIDGRQSCYPGREVAYEKWPGRGGR